MAASPIRIGARPATTVKAIGVERAFLLGAVLMALGFLTTFFLPEIPLRGTVQDHPTG